MGTIPISTILLASAGCGFLLAAALWRVSHRTPGGDALRSAALAQAVVSMGTLVRIVDDVGERGWVFVLATVCYVAHAVLSNGALHRLHGRTPWRRTGVAVLLAAAAAATTSLWEPEGSMTGAGIAYLLGAAAYAACVPAALRGATREERAETSVLALTCGAVSVLFVAWGSTMIDAPERIDAGNLSTFAASFLLGLGLNLASTLSYLLLSVRRMVREVEAHAVTDPLTGALNRRGLAKRLAARDGPRVQAVIAIDLDHFKRVNDDHGHAAGDTVLEACANRLRASLRSQDLLVRVGGEEFLVVLRSDPAPDAGAVAERLRASLAAQPIRTAQGVELRVTVSCGFAVAEPSTPAPLERLADAADRALYLAKQAGRNRVVGPAWLPAPG